MNEKKEAQAEAAAKVKMNTGKIVDAYNLLDSRSDQITGRPGFKLSVLDADEIFIVLRALSVMEPIVDAFNSFREKAKQNLKPKHWDDLLNMARKDLRAMSKEDKHDLKILDIQYAALVEESCRPEREKDWEIDSYEHLSEESFGMLIKENLHLLDVHDIRILREVIG